MPQAMIHIGLLSDTHGHWDERMTHHLSDCDEIWHAGDLGSLDVVDKMNQIAPTTRVVYGNIDDHLVRLETELTLNWQLQGLRFTMTHIGGKPGRYAKGIPALLDAARPDVFICGHSHLLKIERDVRHGSLYINPGAAGVHGFHKKRTLIKFSIDNGQLANMRAVELGDRLVRTQNK
jgi:putative phosphoesterase